MGKSWDCFFLRKLILSRFPHEPQVIPELQMQESEDRDTLKPCVSILLCDLRKSQKSPAQAPSACHQAQSHRPAQCLASNQIFYFSCQAADISHFSSDLDGPNGGIHYHTRTVCGFTLFFFRPHRLSWIHSLRGPQLPVSSVLLQASGHPLF